MVHFLTQPHQAESAIRNVVQLNQGRGLPLEVYTLPPAAGVKAPLGLVGISRIGGSSA